MLQLSSAQIDMLADSIASVQRQIADMPICRCDSYRCAVCCARRDAYDMLRQMQDQMARASK